MGYYRSKNYLSKNIYNNQKKSSKRRNHELPNYSLEEFRNWLFSQDNFDKLGNFIKEHLSVIDAENKTGINCRNISKVCLNRYGFKTAGNFVWKFK